MSAQIRKCEGGGGDDDESEEGGEYTTTVVVIDLRGRIDTLYETADGWSARASGIARQIDRKVAHYFYRTLEYLLPISGIMQTIRLISHA